MKYRTWYLNQLGIIREAQLVTARQGPSLIKTTWKRKILKEKGEEKIWSKKKIYT
jgi:hypothetical protein